VTDIRAFTNAAGCAEEDRSDELDAISYEVLRHRLWAINEEHGITLLRISGSPAAVYAQDFNPGILTAEGEWVYFGPYVQFMTASADAAVRWVLEHRAVSPGIHEGDIFITNDPWVSSIHQQDVVVVAPVFVHGELTAWVSNTLHMYDIGGPTPGSYCPTARNVYEEPPMFPPIKIQEAGVPRLDVFEVWLRQSRTPDKMALDLNGLMAGCNVAAERIQDTCERYGARQVRATMMRIISNAEKTFVQRLSNIPDGTWRERGYIEVAYPDDRGVYANVLQVTKSGTELYFSNEGSAPQVGSINCTVNSWRGAIMAALNPPFLSDQLNAIGGALRHCHFEPREALINSAQHPMGVSNSSPCLMLNTIAVANNCLARMLACDEEMKQKLLVSGAMSIQVVDVHAGIDQRGEAFGLSRMDSFLGAVSGSAVRDGIDTGGHAWAPKGTAPNVEHNEQSMPILYLWRRNLVDSGGAGLHRGGNGAVMAIIPHRTDRIVHHIAGFGMAVPTSTGIFGGEPAAPNRVIAIRQSNARELLERGRIPRGAAEITGEHEYIHARGELLQGPDDVWLNWYAAGGGYGSPLDRPAEAVLADVDSDVVSRESALRNYGVRLDQSEGDLRLADDTAAAGRAEYKPT
jgi:N-methylhydantoinase B